MNRGLRRQNVFLDDRDRRTFLGLVREVHKRFDVSVGAYCLMGNHYHMLLYCPRGKLSESMGYLGSQYVRLFNRSHGFDGPLFRSRFTSKLIESDAYLLTANRYIHRNPNDLGYDLATYRWSSYRAFVGRAPKPRWLKTDPVLRATGGITGYSTFVETDFNQPTFAQAS